MNDLIFIIAIICFWLDLILKSLATTRSETLFLFFGFDFGDFLLKFDFFKTELDDSEAFAFNFTASTLGFFSFEITMKFMEEIVLECNLIEGILIIGAIQEFYD